MKRKINAVIIHCAATPNGKAFTVADIDRMHKARGFKRDSQAARSFNSDNRHVGYHYVIEVDGNVSPGRHIEEIGAHVQGSNARSIGICMVGTDKFTPPQWQSLRNVVVALAGTIQGRAIMQVETAILAYADMHISLKGHRDHSPDLNGDGKISRNEWLKVCPGFEVKDWVAGDMLPLEGHIHVPE